MHSGRALLRVLVVDDERIIADTLALILRGKGFDALAVYSGEEAAELALSWEPDAVIADVIMAHMNGIMLASYLAQALPACRVLLISGNIQTAHLMSEARSEGYEFPILAKPFHPEDVFDFLKPSALGTA